MKKIIILLLFNLPLVIYSQQEHRAENAVYAELLGTGFVFTLNYDRTIYQTEKSFVNLKAGLFPGAKYKSYVIGASFNYGKKKHFLETGITGNYLLLSGELEWYTVSPVIGYKLMFQNGLYLKILFSPHIIVYNYDKNDNTSVFPYGGISIGYSF